MQGERHSAGLRQLQKKMTNCLKQFCKQQKKENLSQHLLVSPDINPSHDNTSFACLFLCVSKVNGNASENRDFFCNFFLCTVNIQSINKRKNTYNLAHMVFSVQQKDFFF